MIFLYATYCNLATCLFLGFFQNLLEEAFSDVKLLLVNCYLALVLQLIAEALGCSAYLLFHNRWIKLAQ